MKKVLLLLVLMSFGVSWGQTYNQITLLSELTNGDYLIVGDGAANDGIMLNTINASPYINFTTVTNPGATITTGFTAANVFTVNVLGGIITIFNAELGYVSWGRTGNIGNTATFFNGTLATTEQWTPSVAAGLWTLANVNTAARMLQWNNSSPRFAAYTSAQVRLKLYKLASLSPTVTTPTSTSITTTTATLGANVTADGGASISSRGTVWGPAALPTGNLLAEGGTAVAAFSHTRTGFTANTFYTYRGYAINTNGTGYSPDGTFTTLHNAPNVGNGSGATSTSIVANWTAPTGGGAAAFSYEIQVDDDIAFGSVNFTQNAISSGTLTTTAVGLSPSTTYYYRVRAVNAGGNSAWSTVSVGYSTLGSTPTIAVTSYGHNSTFAYGNVALGNFLDQTFTINNSGTAVMNISSIVVAGTGYALQGAVPTSVVIGGNATFTVRFTPTTINSFPGTVTINNNSSNQLAYVINFTGSGTPSVLSTITTDTTYGYENNILYANYQATPAPTSAANSIGVHNIIITDGADVDTLPTILNAISFTYTGDANTIRTAALFTTSNSQVAVGTVGANSISFAGLSGVNVTALDGVTAQLILRVTFTNTVTDNQKLVFTVSSATAAGSSTSSLFTSFGAVSDNLVNDRNRIEVVADRLAFVQQPTGTSTNAVMNPAVTLSANDLYARRDLDFGASVSVTSTGILTGNPISINAVNGLATYAALVHTTPATGLTLTGAATGLITIVSSTFAISSFTFLLGDFRPLTATDLSSNGQWEYFDGSGWVAVPDGRAPQNTITTVSRVIINANVGGGGSTSKAYNCDFIIQAGGQLAIQDDDLSPAQNFVAANKKLEVLSGGTLNISGDIGISSTGNLIIKSGGQMILNQPTMTNDHVMWSGVELFEGGSTVTVNNWNWNAVATARSLINITTAITNNANGYKFGNFIFDATPTNTWTLVGGAVNVINLCENDLSINNTSALNIGGSTNSTGTNGFVIGGNMIIYDGPFSFGSSFNTGTFNHQFTINGNFECASNDELLIHNNVVNTATTLNGNVTFKGDVKVASTVTFGNELTASSTGMIVNMEGGTAASPKLIDIAPTVTAVRMNLKNNGYRKLATQNLTLNSISGYAADFTSETGSTLDFGWATNGTTPLNIIKATSSPAGTNSFISQTGTTFVITSLAGLDATSGSSSNLRMSNASTINQTATFKYVGKANQLTGNAMTASGTAKTIIAELESNALSLTFNTSTGITSPGLLNIKKGQVIETDTDRITGSTGGLTMEDGTLYEITSNSPTDNLPRLSGLANAYNLLGTSTIKLSGANGTDAIDQILRGARAYRNLTFSNAGVKTVSSAPTSITGTIQVQDAAILDVANSVMGGSGTNLKMTGTAEYKTAGTGTKPDADGSYDLGTGTKVTFTNGAATLQSIRISSPTVNYYNVDIIGNNVGTTATGTGFPIVNLKMQANGTFTVKPTGVFKHSNTAGFSGSASTAIDNTNLPTITLETGSTIDYSGAAQTVTNAINYKNLRVSTAGIKTISNDVKAEEDVTVTAGELKIQPDKNLIVTNKVSNTGGTITFENNASLLQINNVANDGAIKYKRNATDITGLDYVYWSSPVNGQDVNTIYSSPVSGPKYYWNTAVGNSNGGEGNWEGASGIMGLAQGYIVRGSSSISMPAQAIASQFDGVPRNGNIPFTVSRGTKTADFIGTNTVAITQFDDNFNLLGNPYPSAMNALAFLQANAYDVTTNPTGQLLGTVKLWQHGFDPAPGGNPFYGSFTSNYSASDYLTINFTGPTIPGGSDIIKAGQGFFVTMIDGAAGTGTVNFNNAMRFNAGNPMNNAGFFRTSNNENVRSRIWLNLVKAQNNNVIASTMVGYVANATNGYDNLYDAMKTDQIDDGLFSVIDHKLYEIQGRAPFTATDQVPIAYQVAGNGNYFIAINGVDGLFLQGQTIYLQDNLLNATHNLSLNPYQFTSLAGVFNNRFVLKYTNTVLDNPTLDYSNSVFVYKNNESIGIKSNSENIESIVVFDILGRNIYQKNNIKALQFDIQNLTVSNATLIVKIVLENGKTMVKKIAF